MPFLVAPGRVALCPWPVFPRAVRHAGQASSKTSALFGPKIVNCCEFTRFGLKASKMYRTVRLVPAAQNQTRQTARDFDSAREKEASEKYRTLCHQAKLVLTAL
jgi:hypothetical protein